MEHLRYTFGESCELLGIDPKTAKRKDRGWLAGVPFETDPYDRRRHYYTRAQLLEVATAHGRQLTDEDVPAPTLEQLTRRVEALERALAELRASRASVPRATGNRTSTPQAHPSDLALVKPQEASGELPDGWIPFSVYCQRRGVRDSTADNAIDAGLLEVTRGHWKIGRYKYEKMLTPEQQLRFDALWPTS